MQQTRYFTPFYSYAIVYSCKLQDPMENYSGKTTSIVQKQLIVIFFLSHPTERLYGNK